VDITYRRVEPDDADRLVVFLTGDQWPFHGSPVVTADVARRWVAAGRYYGDDNTVFDLRLRAQFRGQGIGGQALRWLTAYLFTELPAIRRVEGHTRQDNRVMRRAFERAGYVKEAHHRDAWPVDGGAVHDAVGYAILRRDWLAGTTTAPDWHDEQVAEY
jgi:GNAT superfamily N-acetyltransferase